MLEIIYKSLKGIFGKGIRTILTVMGIAVGVASVIITSNVSQCGSEALSGEIDGLGIGGIAISLKNGNAPLTENELADIKSLSYVDYAMPLVFETTNASIHGKDREVSLWGIDQSAEKTISLNLLYGRLLNTGDIASGAKNCIVDRKFASDSYGTDNIVGKKLNITSGGINAEYTIVGIINTGSGLLQNMMGSYIPSFVYIPYTTMQSNLASSNFTQIVVKTKNDTDYDTAGEDIVKNIERNTNVKNSYTVVNLAKQKENIDNILNIFTIVLSCIGAVSLFVAGLSIMNVMLVSVTERTREIGIKKAIGASKGSIVTEFLAESAAISFIGCITGIIFGMALSYIGVSIFGLTLSVRIDIIIGTIIFSVFIGTIFGIYPALKASNLKPVEALRFY